jgi:hypothetical protein
LRALRPGDKRRAERLMPEREDWLVPFVGKAIVCDLDEYYMVLGTLESFSVHHLQFSQADLHDHREANSSKEVYVIESRRLGIRVNRLHLYVPRGRVVAVSLLDDIAP